MSEGALGGDELLRVVWLRFLVVIREKQHIHSAQRHGAFTALLRRDAHGARGAMALLRRRRPTSITVVDPTEDQLALERAKIEKLQRQQREALRRSQDQRMELYRELIEERILKDELAAEPEQY